MASMPRNRIRDFVEGIGAKSSERKRQRNGESAKEALEAAPKPKCVLDLSLGDPTSFGLSPPSSASTALVQCVTQADAHCESGLGFSAKQVHGYQHSQGSLPLRQKLSLEYLRPALASPEDIFITSGCSQALLFALMVITPSRNAKEPVKNVLVPRPCFPLYLTLCEHLGVECRYYDLDPSKGWEVSDIARDLGAKTDGNTVCLLICNPGNPTSHCYGKKHLEDLCRFAAGRNLPIVADEVYADMKFKASSDGEDVERFYTLAEVALERLGSSRPAIFHCGAFSKRFLVPGWRLGWLALYDDANQSMRKANVFRGVSNLCQISMTPNSIVQASAVSMMQNTPPSYFEEMLEMMREGAEYCVKRCASCLGLECMSEPQGAMYFMPKIDLEGFKHLLSGSSSSNGSLGGNEDERWCLALLEEEQVMLLPGSLFGIDSFVRMIVAAPRQQLKEAWDRIEAFCEKYYQHGA